MVKRLILTLVMVSATALGAGIFAQTIHADVTIPAPSTSDQTAAQKAQLQAQLQDLQNQISQLQSSLGTIDSQKDSLQNKLSQLENQQHTLQLQIQATDVQITQTNDNIAQTQTQIAADQLQVTQQETQMAQLLQLVNQRDQTPLIYALATGKSFSDVMDDIENYEQTSGALDSVVTETQQVEQQLQTQVTQYQTQQDSDQNFLDIQSLQQHELASSTSEQADLLKETKGRESDYQIAIKGTQAQATQIEAQLYQLAGGGATGAVTFGQAATIAENVSSEVGGGEAAFLLAILTQESNLGQNVGTCNRAGDPPSKSYTAIMKPDRDIQPFLSITSQLGLDPTVTPVSCPLYNKNGTQNGWGGAMGPAQFIPSTWVGYEAKVTAITGQPANPFNINDAFLASALKLKAGGADGTYQGDWDAAMRYFSGSLNLAYRFYGDEVMATTAKYQADLQTIGQ
jgi:peptidoglycan hydrolase CwlO-like protein